MKLVSRIEKILIKIKHKLYHYYKNELKYNNPIISDNHVY